MIIQESKLKIGSLEMVNVIHEKREQNLETHKLVKVAILLVNIN